MQEESSPTFLSELQHDMGMRGADVYDSALPLLQDGVPQWSESTEDGLPQRATSLWSPITTTLLVTTLFIVLLGAFLASLRI